MEEQKDDKLAFGESVYCLTWKLKVSKFREYRAHTSHNITLEHRKQ